MSAFARRVATRRPAYVWAGIGLEVFVGLMAAPFGLMMIADPNGSPVGLPHEWIAGTPFGSYLLPGILLFTVNGIGQLAAAALGALDHWLAPWLMGALGIGLMIWIGVQVLIIPLSFLQPTIFVIGAIQGFVALFWLRRRGAVRTS